MAAAVTIGVALLVLAVAVLAWSRTRRGITSPGERVVYDTLRLAAAAGRPVRRGLDEGTAEQAVPQLRQLIGSLAVGIADPSGTVLGWNGESAHAAFPAAVAEAVAGERRVLTALPGASGVLVAQPIVTDGGSVVGVLGVVTEAAPSPGLLGVVSEVAGYLGGQIELADLEVSRARLDRAEVLALRAQISPHFIYNALNTIASFVRTDPDRARELILEFADFTRYSFRTAGEFTVLADELRNIDRYLTLERARFGDALSVRIQVAPEVLSVVLPFLALQPLVENAVRHGISGRSAGTVVITATDEGPDCVISVEDDGVGMDPELLRSGALDAVAAGPATSAREVAHVGLANVDDRLRAAFGNDYGLVVETAVGAGTKVILRVPKFRAGVHQ